MPRAVVVRALLSAESVWSFGAGLFFPIFAIYSAQVGGDILDAGIAAAIFIFVTSVLEYPIGKLIDKFREKWFIVADYFLEGLVFVGYIFVTDIYQLFALQAVLGFANAIGDPAWESLYDRATPERKSGSYWANSHFYIGIFNAGGILLGAYIVHEMGFPTVFALGAAFSFSACLIAIRYIRRI
jgi:MFS family permease